uniref:WW domain-containing protein n=1 Tax=Peronospora matthiolae TaxID=2874970 RepID=A0AAV1U1R8_9STRA
MTPGRAAPATATGSSGHRQPRRQQRVRNLRPATSSPDDVRTHQSLGPRQMVQGYAGGYAGLQEGRFTGQPARSPSVRDRNEQLLSNRLQENSMKTSTSHELQVKRQLVQQEREEELAGRPAMIAMDQDDLPALYLKQERRSGDRRAESYYPDGSRGEKARGHFTTGGVSHGNCRSSRAVSGSRLNVQSHSSRNSASRSRGSSSSNYHRQNAGAVRHVDNDQCQPAPARTEAPAARQQVSSVYTSVPVRAAVKPATRTEPIVWRVAMDPKSKRPYYYHTITWETTWKKPAELVAAETREKRQFFSVMENNIRLKLRDGYYTRDSETSNSNHSTPDAVHKPHNEVSPRTSCRSSASTASTRSSLSSYTGGSGRSLPGSARQLIMSSTRSLPATPEVMDVPYLGPTETQPQQEPESIARDSEESRDSMKRPSLFRTLSSYETPVMTSCRKSGDVVDLEEVGCNAPISLVTPSPIQECVCLATLMSRASDLETYARAAGAANGYGRPSLQALSGRGSSASALVNAQAFGSKGAFVNKPCTVRRRSNSTNSIYLRMGTMDTPDQDATIQCVATVLRAHMMEALEDPIRSEPRFDVFVTAHDHQCVPSLVDELSTKESCFAEMENNNVMVDVVPTLSEIATFVKHVFSRAQMESECIIMSLVYVERLLKATSGSLQLRGENWQRLVFCSMVMASKVWDDLSMTNADFSRIWPELSLKLINELELVYLSAVEYNVRVSAASYAKYYFHLRSMCATMGLLEAFDESAPLNLDGARKMQVLSEEYQERSKLMPAPRRRSVTITSTSVGESMQTGGSARRLEVGGSSARLTKASPAASLEQLVRMQLRVAGGSSLRSSMHRLTTAKQ